MSTSMANRLSANRIDAARGTIDRTFLNSPQFMSEPLSAMLGCNLILKFETLNPIGSFKGRGTSHFVNSLKTNTALVTASAGNFGQGLAYAGRARNIPVTVFASTHANTLKIERMRALGADVRLAGDDFDAAKAHARAFAHQHNAKFVEDGKDIEISEGAGTIAPELFEAFSNIDALLIPVGNGALINGIAAWTKTRQPGVRVIGVCAENAPAMALSFAQHRKVITERANTIADGIAVREPVDEALDDMAGLVDEMLLVSDADILTAMRRLLSSNSVATEPAGVAALAAAFSFSDRWKNRTVALPICGSNVTPAQFQQWYA